MDRTVPYDKNAKCDECNKKGAYDFMGDYLCEKCAYKEFHKPPKVKKCVD